MKKFPPVLMISMVFLVLAVHIPRASAHKVIVFAWIENSRIHVEGGFGGKRPAKNCEVTAVDTAGNTVFQGVTDTRGRLSFALPQGFSSDMVIVLSAGPGHKGSWTIAAEEFNGIQNTGEGKGGSLTQDPVRQNPLKQGTDPLKIVAGIAVIFGLALLVKQIRSKKNPPQKG